MRALASFAAAAAYVACGLPLPLVRSFVPHDRYSHAVRRKLEAGAQLRPYVIMLHHGVADNESELVAQALQASSDAPEQVEFAAHVAVRLTGGLHGVMVAHLTQQAAQWLAAHASVELVEEDVMLHAAVMPGEVEWGNVTVNGMGQPAGGSLLSGQPFLATEGAVAQFDAPFSLDRLDQRRLPLDATFRYTSKGAGVDVYVMDSGVRTSHVEFEGRWTAGRNFSPDQPEYDWQDCAGHGTHVASLAVGSNLGVAKDATLFPVRIYDCDNAGPLSNALQGIDWVVLQVKTRGKPAVINMSFGGPISSILNRAITRLTEAGALVVVAAGNDAVDACAISPASARDAVTVGAISNDDTYAPYSNHGRCVDILAPGTQVPGASASGDTAVKLMSGSSMAAPLVAGTAALLLQSHSLSPRDAKRALLCSATEGVIREVPADTRNELVFSPPGGWGDQGAGGCAVAGAGADAPSLQPVRIVAVLAAVLMAMQGLAAVR